MNPKEPPPPEDVNEKISALIETLHQTGQRLEELTAGEVDAVTDRDGRPFLLRRAQDHMRHSEAAILNALPANIALLDAQGLIISVNEAWLRFASVNAILGQGHGIGVNYLEICDSARGEGASEAHQAAAGIRSVLGGGVKSFSLEYPCHSPTEQRWFLLTVTPLVGDHPNGVVVMHLNITERKKAAQELRESERRFSDLLENVELISMMLDCEARVTYCNEYLLHLTGWQLGEVIGRNWFDLFVPPEINDLKFSFFAALLANQPEARHHENEILTRSGERRLIRWNNSVLRSGADDVIGTASIGEDITERKKAQASIVYLNRVYAMLSGINTLIVRVRERDEL
ncbi:MAG: PAS domain-containing protein, partial [Pseudohongiella sp.]|nr:PAS domain-containing protein [Pseudohongiella sp.]